MILDGGHYRYNLACKEIKGEGRNSHLVGVVGLLARGTWGVVGH